MAKAPREPSLVQKDLLASELKTRPDSDRPRATKPDFLLYKVAKCRLCKIAEAMSNFPLCEVTKCQLYKIAETMSNLLLYKVAKCQLYKIAKAVPNIQPYNTVKPKLNYIIARS
jgi:hypothetical protein